MRKELICMYVCMYVCMSSRDPLRANARSILFVCFLINAAFRGLSSSSLTAAFPAPGAHDPIPLPGACFNHSTCVFLLEGGGKADFQSLLPTWTSRE